MLFSASELLIVCSPTNYFLASLGVRAAERTAVLFFRIV